MNWKKFLANLGVSAGVAFLGTLQTGGSVKSAAAIAGGTALANLVGLVQHPPQVPKAE